MMGKWSLKPDKELLGYLGCDIGDNSGKNVSAKNNSDKKKWAPKPSQELRSYLDGAGTVETPPAEQNTEFGAKDYLKAFNEWNERNGLSNGIDVPKAYEMTGECSPLPKTETEIQALLDLIPEKSANHAGVFISYIVNEVYTYDEIKLRTNKPIGFLGTKNASKKLTIMGNVENKVGTSMTGGELVIKGNSGNDIGWCMDGGKITVEGSAGWRVGENRSGGEIHLLGDFKSIGDRCYDTSKTGRKTGAVYHNGEQIY